MQVEVDNKEIRKFRKFCRNSYPKECCGFLIGVELKSCYIIEKIYIPEDQDKYATENYIDLNEDWFIESRKYAKNLDLQVLGFIHSHPDFIDTSLSEQDHALTKTLKYWFRETVEPIMGVVAVWKRKNLMTRLSFWPMFDQFKIKKI